MSVGPPANNPDSCAIVQIFADMLMLALVVGFAVGWIRDTWTWARASLSNARNTRVLRRKPAAADIDRVLSSSAPSSTAGSAPHHGGSRVFSHTNSLYRSPPSVRVRGAGMNGRSLAAATSAIASVEASPTSNASFSAAGGHPQRGWRQLKRLGSTTATASASFLSPWRNAGAKSVASMSRPGPVGEGDETFQGISHRDSGVSTGSGSSTGAMQTIPAALSYLARRRSAAAADPPPLSSTGAPQFSPPVLDLSPMPAITHSGMPPPQPPPQQQQQQQPQLQHQQQHPIETSHGSVHNVHSFSPNLPFRYLYPEESDDEDEGEAPEEMATINRHASGTMGTGGGRAIPAAGDVGSPVAGRDHLRELAPRGKFSSIKARYVTWVSRWRSP